MKFAVHISRSTIVLLSCWFQIFSIPVSKPVLRLTLPASWDENWFGSPAVYDLDAAGGTEIIAGRHSVLYVWNSHGALLWRAPVGENATSPNNHGKHRQYAAPVVGDLDSDGDGEIAIAYSDSVAVYDHTGKMLPGWPRKFPGGNSGEIRSIAGKDLNRDGRVEIVVVKTMKGPVTMAWDIGGAAVPGWPQASGYAGCNDYGGFNQNIGVADLDGDAIPEVVCTYDICHIGIMRGNGAPVPAHSMFSKAGPWASSVPMFHDIGLAKQGWGADGNDRDEFTDSSPCFGDIDGDGLFEVVLYSDHELAGEYKNRGNSLWVLNPDMTRVKGFEKPLCSKMPLFTGYQNNIVQVAPAPALADLTGDHRPEIVAPSYDGTMRCFSPDGAVLWGYAFDSCTANDTFIGASGAVIGDLNQDAAPEIVFTTYSTHNDRSHLIVLDARGAELHKVSIPKRGSMSPPTLADVDGNQSVEIVLSLKDVVGGTAGGVQVWDVPSATTNRLLWPTGRGNNLRTGLPPFHEPPAVLHKPAHANGFPFCSEGAGMKFYNSKGQMVFETAPAAGPPRTLPPGIYFVVARCGHGAKPVQIAVAGTCRLPRTDRGGLHAY